MTIDEIRQKMCDDYCHVMYLSLDDETMKPICSACPLNELDRHKRPNMKHREWIDSVLKANDEMDKAFGRSIEEHDLFLQSIAYSLADIADLLTDFDELGKEADHEDRV